MDNNHIQDQHSINSRANAMHLEDQPIQNATEYLSPPSLNVTASYEMKSKTEEVSEIENIEHRVDSFQENPAVQMQEETGEEEIGIEKIETQVQHDTPHVDPPEDSEEEDPPNANNSESSIISQMEHAFNTSFKNVDIIQNSSEAKNLGAKAFALGNSIHFAPGAYDVSSEDGRALLGHELAHVVQQRQGRVQPTTELAGFQINDDKNLEQEADQLGRLAARKQDLPPFNINERKNPRPSVLHSKVVQRALSENQVKIAIEGLHNRLDQHGAVRILRENNEDLEIIKTAFAERYGTTLRTYIKDMYNDIDLRIKATALLFDPSYTLPHTQVALALIPLLTRDIDFFTIMGNLSIEQKRELRQKYNARFSNIGAGGLDADIRGDFEGEDEMRAWMISYRTLTDADNIYLDTAGQYGTNVLHLVGTIRRLWGYGADTFDQKLNQWNPNNNLPDIENVSSSPAQFLGYFDHPNDQFGMKISQIGRKSRSLMYTVLEEISGSTKRNIESIFVEYVEQKAGFARPEGEDEGGWAFSQEEESNLRIARQRLDGGETLLDDTDEINSAVDEIIAIYEGRVIRLRTIANNVDNIRHATYALVNVRERLISHHGASALRVADRNMADEVHFLSGDQSLLQNKILEYYKAGKLAELQAEAAVAFIENNVEIRPVFTLVGILHQSNARSGEVINLINNHGSQATRGAIFIQRIISREYVQAPTLTFLHQFINQGIWDNALRFGILSEYCRRRCPSNAAQRRGSVSNAVVFHLYELGFGNFSNWPLFRDALAPVLSNDNRVARVRADLQEEESSTIGNFATNIIDSISGEDTRDVTHTSLQNLELFANRARANSAEMEAFRAFYGEDLDLVSREYDLFHERLASMRKVRNEIASFANMVVATVLEIALAPIISPIGSAIVAQALGILTEWSVNPESEPISAENLIAVIGAGVTTRVGLLFESEALVGRMLHEQIANRYLRTATSEAMQQAFDEGVGAFAQGIAGGLDRQDILASVESILARAASGGIVNGRRMEDVTNSVIQNTLDGVASNVLQEGMRSGAHIILQPGDTERDMANRITNAAISAALSGSLSSVDNNEGMEEHTHSTEHPTNEGAPAISAHDHHSQGGEDYVDRDAIVHTATPHEDRLTLPSNERTDGSNDIEDHDNNGVTNHGIGSPDTLTYVIPDDHADTEHDIGHAEAIPAPTNETSLPDSLVDIEPVDTSTPSFDVDQLLVPDEAYTQHAVARPQGEISANLTSALTSDEGNHNEQQFVLDHVIADTRFYLAGENSGILQPFANMAGQCGMARDLSGALLQGMSNDPGLDVRSLTAEIAFNQDDSESLAGSTAVQHSFTVTRFPNGQAYIVDPSFSQFVSAGLTHERIEGLTPDEYNVAFPANQHLDGGDDGRVIHQLLDRGYLPLNPENAQVYGRLLGYGGTLDGESIMTYMLGGRQDTNNTLSRQEVMTSLQEQANTYPENSPQHERIESLMDEI